MLFYSHSPSLPFPASIEVHSTTSHFSSFSVSLVCATDSLHWPVKSLLLISKRILECDTKWIWFDGDDLIRGARKLWSTDFIHSMTRPNTSHNGWMFRSVNWSSMIFPSIEQSQKRESPTVNCVCCAWGSFRILFMVKYSNYSHCFLHSTSTSWMNP